MQSQKNGNQKVNTEGKWNKENYERRRSEGNWEFGLHKVEQSWL